MATVTAGQNVTIHYDALSTVLAIASHGVGAGSVAAVHTQTVYAVEVRRGNGTTLLEATSDSWTRATDGAQLEIRTRNVLTTGEEATTRYSNVTYTAPCPGLQWPLAVGATWQTTCTAATDGPVATTTTDYHVASLGDVVVPAGNFTAYRVEATARSSTGLQTDTTLWYAPRACNFAKVHVVQAGNVASDLELKAYGCAATA